MPNTEKKKKKKLEIKKMIYNFKTTKVQPTKARGGEAQWLGLCIHPTQPAAAGCKVQYILGRFKS